MRVYKYYPAEWGRKAILHQRLKLTTLEDINDPFEFRAIGTRGKSLRRILENWRVGLPGRLGLIAFCQNRENPVIWSHYTESYRGICLGFDVPKEYLLPVSYVSERVVMTQRQVEKKLVSGGFQDLLTTKFEHWSYEAERRVIYRLDEPEVQQDDGRYFVPFGKMFALREVILGHNYEPKDDSPLRTCLNDVISRTPGCKVKTARAAFQTFRIVEQKDPSLQKVL